MTVTSFRFQPHDVLFFRDGRPSSIGEDHFHRSIFPPNPSTLYGAIRTRRLLDEGIDLSRLKPETWEQLVKDDVRAEVGTPQSPGSLSLRGPWLIRDGQVLLPAPADLGVTEEWTGGVRRVRDVARYRPDPEPETRPWSHRFALLRPSVQSDEDLIPPDGWFLGPEAMNTWLDGGIPHPEHFIHSSALWAEEVRTGVGLQESHRTSETSKLYTFGFVRLRKGVSIGFEISDGALETGSAMTLGGEGRGGMLLDGPALGLSSRPQGQRFTLYLGTPAIFDQGIVPDSFDATTNYGSIQGQPCRLIAPVCRGYHLIGGWNLAERRPRPLRRAVPAGTVLLFERGGAAEPRALMNPELVKQGFGLSIVGAVA